MATGWRHMRGIRRHSLRTDCPPPWDWPHLGAAAVVHRGTVIVDPRKEPSQAPTAISAHGGAHE